MGETAELHRLPARYIAQLVDYLESIGIDRGRLLRAARIRSIDTPKAQVTLRQVEALLRAAEQASGRMDLGFELGRRLNPTSHDVLGFALLTSPTFGHYLRLAVSYQRLIQPVFALTLQRRAGQVDLVYLPAVARRIKVMAGGGAVVGLRSARLYSTRSTKGCSLRGLAVDRATATRRTLPGTHARAVRFAPSRQACCARARRLLDEQTMEAAGQAGIGRALQVAAARPGPADAGVNGAGRCCASPRIRGRRSNSWRAS